MSVYRQWGATLALFSTLAIASADLVQTQSAIAQPPSPPRTATGSGSGRPMPRGNSRYLYL
ncbi:hypothetical protein QM565_19230 [Geitlerinema splendidum]|nr:hypothetical protein [Geitlerinema splendidum]